MKIMENKTNNILINQNITLDENSSIFNIVNILEENENLPLIDDNINLENILNFDFRKLLKFYFLDSSKELNLNHDLINEDINKENNPTFLGRKRMFKEEEKIVEEKKEILRKNIISR
jgi:hypothetical protein